jgi:acyl-CoA thioesterase FadM
MNLWFRLLNVLIASLFRPRLDLTDPSFLRFRVLPHDLDLNMHMNNARYLALMDLGRIDFIARSGIWRPMFRQRWRPVVGGALVRFRRSLNPFQAVALTSRVVCWDAKWLYFAHRIEAGGALACLTVVRAAFVGASGVVAPAELMREAGIAGRSPQAPDWVAQWGDLDTAFAQEPSPKVSSHVASEENTSVG